MSQNIKSMVGKLSKLFPNRHVSIAKNYLKFVHLDGQSVDYHLYIEGEHCKGYDTYKKLQMAVSLFIIEKEEVK